ncbi:MAG: PH domain-containing protein [Muribaculaceae bacterium]|nr:PH domain-containing protein [Muribaculaceae bacterium]
MTRKVKYSSFSWSLTAVLLVGAVAGSVYFRRESWVFPTLVAVLSMMVVSVLFYAPLAIHACGDNIVVISVIKHHRIPIRDVASVELFRPTMGAVRVCGSGGLMGYWGLFSENDIGRYFAYYGKASDCFLVVLKNGKKYVLGCEHPAEMVACIKDAMRS